MELAPAAIDRREEIIEATLLVLARRGFKHTRMSDIAEEMGVTAPLLLHYFESKNDIVTTALVTFDEPYLHELLQDVSAGVAPQSLLVNYIEDTVWPVSDQSWAREATAIWMNAWIAALDDPAIAQARRNEDHRWREAMASVVRAGQQRGCFNTSVDAEEFVKTLFALLDGFTVQVALKDPDVTKEFGNEQALSFAGRVLDFDPTLYSQRPP